MRPYLGQVERIEAIGGRVLKRHNLYFQRPRGVISASDAVEQIAPMKIRVVGGHRFSFAVGEILDPLFGLEVVLDPHALAIGVDPQEGVAAVAVHVPPGARRPAVAHQEGHLV